MRAASRSRTSRYYDLVGLQHDHGPAARAAFSAGYGARVLSFALTDLTAFWNDVEEVRGGAALDLVARRYVRRARGPRLTVLSTYLEIAATSAPAQNESDAKMRLWNLAPIVYTVDSPVPSSAMPQRLLRNDAADRLIRGAIAVGRMRTRRCGRLECDGGAGTPLSQSNTSALCSACTALDPFAEPALRRAENEVFAAAAKSLAR